MEQRGSIELVHSPVPLPTEECDAVLISASCRVFRVEVLEFQNFILQVHGSYPHSQKAISCTALSSRQTRLLAARPGIDSARRPSSTTRSRNRGPPP